MARVLAYDPTPNPDALRLRLDAAVSAGPRSFLNADDAKADPIAGPLFETGKVRAVLINTDWMTINRKPGSPWSEIKPLAERLLGDAEPVGGA
ncbi:MAG: NifU N-terminal domain-containing protein [Planctomycetota bacterium]